MSEPKFPKHLISINDLQKEHINQVLTLSEDLKAKKRSNLCLQGKLLATLFFEPSTRTRLSFEAAIKKLGGSVISEIDQSSSASAKGESFSDSIKISSLYSDAIVLRHPHEGSAKLASEISDVPIINAGDGSNEHPTQTLLDLFSIQESMGAIDGLNVAFVGDLKHGRTVHSLAKALSHYDVRLYFISPSNLMLPDQIAYELSIKGVKYSFHKSYDEVIDKLDILYMTRLQQERLDIKTEVTPYCLKLSDLSKAKKHLRVLHPLPRVDELDTKIDATDHAYYFQQAQNGLYVRQALLLKLLSNQNTMQGLVNDQTNTFSLSHT